MSRLATGNQKGILGEAAGLSIGAVLAALAAVRRGNTFHPDAVVYDARLTITGDPKAPQAAELLSRRDEHRVIARFSRAVGLPHPMPTSSRRGRGGARGATARRCRTPPTKSSSGSSSPRPAPASEHLRGGDRPHSPKEPALSAAGPPSGIRRPARLATAARCVRRPAGIGPIRPEVSGKVQSEVSGKGSIAGREGRVHRVGG